ncbi:hypothetical protein DPX16_22640 [Anabarilius grahami]|uniref:Uncharacterized protein n=1 Tax=Anabarilius grahami TaxID=495550 RepID=A0A3N0Y5W5_ANAGA|nr:hypothetical protein DPX16_22640 [Anabarilius grahami]
MLRHGLDTMEIHSGVIGVHVQHTNLDWLTAIVRRHMERQVMRIKRFHGVCLALDEAECFHCDAFAVRSSIVNSRYANILPALIHSINEALDLPETAKAAEAAQYREGSVEKVACFGLVFTGLVAYLSGEIWQHWLQSFIFAQSELQSFRAELRDNAATNHVSRKLATVWAYLRKVGVVNSALKK